MQLFEKLYTFVIDYSISPNFLLVKLTLLEGKRPPTVSRDQPRGLSIKSLKEPSGVKYTWLIRPGVTPWSSVVPTGAHRPTAWYKSAARNITTSPGRYLRSTMSVQLYRSRGKNTYANLIPRSGRYISPPEYFPVGNDAAGIAGGSNPSR